MPSILLLFDYSSIDLIQQSYANYEMFGLIIVLDVLLLILSKVLLLQYFSVIRVIVRGVVGNCIYNLLNDVI